MVATDRKLVWTLLILAAAVLGWALAVDLEIGWAPIVGLAAALVPLGLIWLWRRGHGPQQNVMRARP